MMARPEIIPAILPMTFSELEDDAALVKGFVKTIQVDVCDGQFVPNATWPYRKHDDSFERLIKEEIGMPAWQDLNYEFDLMVNDPIEVVEEWVRAGATRIILHAEAKGDLDAAMEALLGRVEIGLALAEETPISAIGRYREKISSVQLMGIEKVGFQHQVFDDRVIGRVREARLKYPGLPISVDGGVSLDNAQALINGGADRLVIGSAIFGADNPLDAVEKFKQLT